MNTMTASPPSVPRSDPANPSAPSKAAFWIGWVLSAIPALMMGGGALLMLFNIDTVRSGMAEHDFTDPNRAAWIILTLEIVCTLFYLIPRTAVLGAILLTGYLGGAIATHLRVEEYPQIVPARVLGVLVWLGLYLRDPRLRTLAPLRTPARSPASSRGEQPEPRACV